MYELLTHCIPADIIMKVGTTRTQHKKKHASPLEFVLEFARKPRAHRGIFHPVYIHPPPELHMQTFVFKMNK